MKQLLNWFRRGNLESGLERELRYHIDRRVSDLMLSGLTERQAQRRAMLELGGLTQDQEERRDGLLTRLRTGFRYGLRFSARAFFRRPAFAATGRLTPAVGL